MKEPQLRFPKGFFMDLNALNASKMTMFRNAVNHQADREIEELTAKIREQRSAAERIREEHESREAMAALKTERNAMEAKYRKELSRRDYEVNKQVLAHRKELVGEFFGKIEQDLREFSESEKYTDFLKKRIEKAEKALGKDVVILAAKKDVERLSSLTEHEVRADSTIVLGGICALDEKRGLFCDFSLDRALDDERAAFAEKRELMTAEI